MKRYTNVTSDKLSVSSDDNVILIATQKPFTVVEHSEPYGIGMQWSIRETIDKILQKYGVVFTLDDVMKQKL